MMSADANIGQHKGDNFTQRASMVALPDREIHDGVMRLPFEP